MILSYSARMAGPYHVEHGLPCQDACAIKEGNDGYVIAVVADGLGSEMYSDIGSGIAASVTAKYCAEQIHTGMTDSEIRKVMNNAFVYAYKAVLEKAAADGNSEDEYDTTLCAAVYDGSTLYFGQSGDSGMVVLLKNGEYRQVTTQQRDDDGDVFPLCWGPEKWVFGKVDGDVSSVMLMTDGVFEQICPPLMKRMECTINIPLAQKFLHRNNCTPDELPELQAAVTEYLEHYPKEQLDDDKTVVVLLNTDHSPEMREDSYYEAPDWEMMAKQAMARLYAAGSDNAAVSHIEADPSGSVDTFPEIPLQKENAADGEVSASESSAGDAAEKSPLTHCKKKDISPLTVPASAD